MTEEEIEKIRRINEKAERERTVPKDKSMSLEEHLNLIQGSLRLCAVAALFCAERESLEVFKAWVKSKNIYPEQEWMTLPVLAQASAVTMEHSKAGEQVRNLQGLVNAFAKRIAADGGLIPGGN